jgi:glycosyltransferase involved in cell wall biosynthesis
MDCFSYHYFLRSKSSSLLDRLFYDREYRRIKRYETSLLATYKNILIISERDKSLLPGVKRHVQVVGNGIEIPPYGAAPSKNTDLLFLGNLRYRPNIEAASFIINEILPVLIKTYPRIRITIAGIDARKKLGFPLQKNIVILENLTETIHVFNGARIFVAPMFMSTGIQNKILESMAHGIPVITTPNAADALGAISGEHLLTAVSAVEFSDQVKKLLSRDELSGGIARNAGSFIREHCNWQKNNNKLEQILNNNYKTVQAAEL